MKKIILLVTGQGKKQLPQADGLFHLSLSGFEINPGLKVVSSKHGLSPRRCEHHRDDQDKPGLGLRMLFQAAWEDIGTGTTVAAETQEFIKTL